MIEKRECLRKKTGSLYDIHRALPVVDPENQLGGGGGGSCLGVLCTSDIFSIEREHCY